MILDLVDFSNNSNCWPQILWSSKGDRSHQGFFPLNAGKMEHVLFQCEGNKHMDIILECIYQWKFREEPTTTLTNSGKKLKMWDHKLIVT